MRIAGIIQFKPAELKSIDLAIGHIMCFYATAITAEDLSDLFSLPLPKMHAGVKRRTGLTIHNYLNSVRIEHAKGLLDNLDHSIKYIAVVIGYKSSSHFIQIFKDRTGITPSQYRGRIAV